MTLMQIQYFLRIAECLSFSKCAHDFFTSQPAVSREISKLETELGVTLFDRRNKSAIKLTQAGMIFHAAFKRVDAEIYEAKAVASALNAPVLRIGFVEGWNIHRIMRFFQQRVDETFPMASVHCYLYPLRELNYQLMSDQLDIILRPEAGIPHTKGFHIRHVGDLRLGLAYTVDSPMAVNQELTLTHFSGRPLFSLPSEESSGLTEQCIQEFLKQGIKLTVQPLPNRNTIYYAALESEGCFIVDELSSICDDRNYSILPIESQCPVSTMWKDYNQSPLIDLLNTEIAALLADPKHKPF